MDDQNKFPQLVQVSFNRWHFLYEYAIKILEQDIERFHKLDDKILKFISFVTIIISVFIAAIPFIFKNYIPLLELGNGTARNSGDIIPNYWLWDRLFRTEPSNQLKL
jgi:hypothetical protein